MMRLVIIAHNIRSAHNVGSIFRTAEGFGVDFIYFSGYTPYPSVENDMRLPHVTARLDKKILKTAIGAERLVPFENVDNVLKLVSDLKKAKYRIVGLEQAERSQQLPQFKPSAERCALVIGEEIAGISKDLQAVCDDLVEIPMHGQKQSFNVAVATGIALYGLLYGHAVGAE